MNTTTMTVDDFLDLLQVSDANLRPQGDVVAYVVADSVTPARVRKAASRIWLVDCDGDSARPITAEGMRAHSPRWSPNGGHLAFLGSRDRSVPDQVHILGQLIGEARALTSGSASVADLAWLPTSDALIVAIADAAPDDEKSEHDAGRDWTVYEDAPRLTRLWRLDIASGNCTPVPHGDLHVWELAIAPDGKSAVAMVSDTSFNWDWYRGRLVRIDLESGEVTSLAVDAGQTTRPTWSPDSRQVASIVSAFSDQGMTGGDVQISGINGDLEVITTGHPRSYLQVLWHQPDQLLCAAIEDGELTVGRLSLSGDYDEIWRCQVGINRYGSTVLSAVDTAQGLRVAAVLSTPQHPAEVHVADVTADGLHRTMLTTTNPTIADRSLVAPETIRWTSSDGTPIQGLLLRPEARASGPLPTIVLVHGGPTALWGYDFMGSRSMGWGQMLAAQGYAILLPNPRGSMGWGRAFAEANVGDMGGSDLQDVLSGVDALVERGIADPDRLGIGGWSYGGYITAWAITQTNRFRAAVAGASITNWISFHGCSTIQDFDTVFYQDDPFGWDGRYGQFSPMAHVRRVSTPTLFLHGEKDPVCPVGQAHEMWRALRECDVETQLVVYPREGHGPIEREHARDVLERAVSWFRERV
ncbi:MAG: S9 family peptidase [Thermomicrobiales bacterium]|nr:S9 family peptidase [Thermomicrobiales bacterium]